MKKENKGFLPYLIETKNALSAKIIFLNQNTWKNSGNNDWEWEIERKCHSIQLDIFSICVLFCFSKTFIYFKIGMNWFNLYIFESAKFVRKWFKY